MSSQNRRFLTPSPPCSLLLSRVYLVNRLWGYSTPYRDDIVYGWPLMQSSFSQNDEIPNSWQTYIVKRQEKETEKLTKLFFKKTRPSSCQFSSPLPFFSTTYFVLCQAFFCSNNVWVLCIFFEAIKNWKIYPSLILTLPVSRCITYNHTFNFTLWHIIFL